MADNVTLDPGTGGAVIKTDDDGVAHWQYVKVAFGADNTQTRVTTGAGLPTDPLDRAARDMGKVDIAMGQAAHDAAGAAIDPVTVGGYASAAAPTDVTADGDICRLWVTPKGAVHIADAGGSISIDDNAGSLTIDGTVGISGTVTVVQATAANLNCTEASASGILTSVQKIDNLAHAGGDVALVEHVPISGQFDDTAPGTVTENNIAPVRITSGRALHVAVQTALPAGTNNIGDVDVLSVVPGTGATSLGKAEDAAHTASDTGVYALAVRDDDPAAHSGTDGDYESFHVNANGGLWVTPTPSTTGGLDTFRSLDLDETEEDVKTSAGMLYGYYLANTHTTAWRYLKLYNATAANVIVGTTTPLITIPIPAGAAANIEFSHGIEFSTAICAAATTGVADADTGAPGANEVIFNAFYK